MNQLKHLFVWLSRITHCRGFGIQSPNDYMFVRYVINEQWPYYKYEEMRSEHGDWLEQKLGQLYFRLANWRQPTTIIDASRSPYWKAGCHNAVVKADAPKADIVLLNIKAVSRDELVAIYNKVDERSLLVVTDIASNKQLWREIQADQRTGVSFDLYYCGIVLFDIKREKRNYIINF